MLGWCTLCCGGVLCGSALCGRAVHCVLGWCTVCYGGVLCARVAYCVGRAV